MLKKLMIAAVIATQCASVTALEPHTDRARIQSMQAELLLPDNSSLPVNMDFDCGSRWENTGMIVMSEQGAQILAAAFTALYGQAAGAAVMQKWHTKAKPEDPRKPTFIIVTPPADADFSISNSNSSKRLQSSASRTTRLNNSSSSIETDESEPLMMLQGSCGSRVHDDN